MKQITAMACTALLLLTGCETVQNWSDSVQSWASNTTAPRAESGADGCPGIQIVPDLAAVHEFADPAMTAPEQLLYQAQIVRADIRCERSAGETVAVLSLGYVAQLGPSGRAAPGAQPSFSNPTFIAYVGADGSILAKDNLTLAATFPAHDSRITVSESARMKLRGDNAGAARLLIGFQLEEWQLAQNRARMTATGQAGALDAPSAAVPVTLTRH